MHQAPRAGSSSLAAGKQGKREAKEVKCCPGQRAWERGRRGEARERVWPPHNLLPSVFLVICGKGRSALLSCLISFIAVRLT